MAISNDSLRRARENSISCGSERRDCSQGDRDPVWCLGSDSTAPRGHAKRVRSGAPTLSTPLGFPLSMLEQLRRNLVLLYAGETVVKFLGLAMFGFLGRVLLEARLGDLEFALGILFLLNLVIDAGLGHYGAREAAKKPAETNRLLGQIALVRGALVLVALLLLVGLAYGLDRDSLARSLILLQGLVLLPTPFVLTWVFQARDEMHVAALANVIRQLLLVVGVFAFVRTQADAWMVPVWDAIGLGAAVAFQVVLFVRAGGIINPFRFVAGVGKVLVESAPLAGSSIVWAVRLYAPLLALGVFSTSEEVGLFASGHRLVISVHTFVWLYYFNLLPSLSRLGTEPGLERFQELFTTSMRLVAWVALAGATVGTLLAADMIPLVYGEAFVEGSAPFAVMVWVLAAGFVSGHHRFSLIALSRQTEEFWASLAGAAVALGGCVFLGLSGDLTKIASAWIFVAAEFTTLLAATGLLARTVPELRVLVGLTRPIGFTVLGVLLLFVWSPASSVLAAAALVGLYGAGIIAFERDDLRRLLAIRRATQSS